VGRIRAKLEPPLPLLLYLPLLLLLLLLFGCHSRRESASAFAVAFAFSFALLSVIPAGNLLLLLPLPFCLSFPQGICFCPRISTEHYILLKNSKMGCSVKGLAFSRAARPHRRRGFEPLRLASRANPSTPNPDPAQPSTPVPNTKEPQPSEAR